MSSKQKKAEVPAPPSPSIPFKKFVRQPDVELEVDLTFSECLKDLSRENIKLQQMIEENNRAMVKIMSNLVKKNGIQLRPGAAPAWKSEDSNILLVPIPDVIQQQ